MDNGRVFMSGADGFLYELQYGNVDGWFQSYPDCKKKARSRKRARLYHFLWSAVTDCSDPIMDMALDDERNILYCLTRASTIDVYDLGADGESIKWVASLDVQTMLKRLRTSGSRTPPKKPLELLQADVNKSLGKTAAGGVPAAGAAAAAAAAAPLGGEDKELLAALVSIAPVATSLSTETQLVATSASGVRVFFRTTPKYGGGGLASTTLLGGRPSKAGARPTELTPLLAVSPPSTQYALPAPSLHERCVLNTGDVVLLASSESQQGGAKLHCVADLALHRPTKHDDTPDVDGAEREKERDAASVTLLELKGAVYAIAEEPQPQYAASLALGRNGAAGFELATQHRTPPRSFVVLTSDGVQRLVKRRPLDLLVEATMLEAQLNPPRLPQPQPGMPMLGMGGPGGGGGGGGAGSLMSPMAELFAHFGADEACSMCLMVAVLQKSGGLAVEPQLSEQLSYWAYRLGGQPREDVAGAAAQGVVMRDPTFTFSGRHGGICRALARLLQPLWAEKIFFEAAPDAFSPPTLRMRGTSEYWKRLQRDLAALEELLKKHAQQWGVELPASHAQQQPSTPLGMHNGAQWPNGGAAGAANGMAANGAPARANPHRKEHQSVAALHSMLRRAKQAAALFKHIAPAAAAVAAEAAAAANGGVGGGGVLPADAAHVLLPQLVAKLPDREPDRLQTKLRALTLQDLVVPLQKDANGKVLAGKGDGDGLAKLLKALFGALGELVGGGAAGVSKLLLQECPEFFSEADEKLRLGRELLRQAGLPETAEHDRPELLQQVLTAFGEVVPLLDVERDLPVVGALVHAVFQQREERLRIADPRSAVASKLDQIIVELSLAAARAADRDERGARLLLQADARTAPDRWQPELARRLCKRLFCYRLLLDKLSLMGPQLQQQRTADGPAAAAAAAPRPPLDQRAAQQVGEGAAARGGEAWLLLLQRALARQPVDPLFHHAAFWWLLEGGRETELLQQPSPFLEAFVAGPAVAADGTPLAAVAPGVRALWGAFLGASIEQLETAATSADAAAELLRLPEVEGMADAVARLELGAMLPSLLLRQERYVEAARRFFALATRATLPPIPGGGANGAAAAAPGAAAASGREPPFRSEGRSLEQRLNFLQQAIQCARLANGRLGGAVVAQSLGADFQRVAEEHHKRAQVQLRIVVELQQLTAPLDVQRLRAGEAPPPKLEQVARGLKRPAADVLVVLRAQLEGACEALLEMEALFKLAWDAQLWKCALAILDFARPYKEYPTYVRTALQRTLQPTHPADETTHWLQTEVRALRREHKNAYIFQADTIVAQLESRQLRDAAAPGAPPPSGGRVPLFLCTAEGGLTPPVPWAEVYGCYGSPRACGPEMAKLWREDRPIQLHLLRSLAALLGAWLRSVARLPAGSPELGRLVESQRQLGIVGHLNDHLTDLAGEWPDDLVDEKNHVSAELRQRRLDLTGLSSLA